MPESFSLNLPISLVSKNVRDKMHWRQRHDLRQSYQDIISLTYPRKHPTPAGKQRVLVTRLMGPKQRRWDPQNIGAGSAIELVDSLKELGWFKDDSERWLEVNFSQNRNPRIYSGPATLVELCLL